MILEKLSLLIMFWRQSYVQRMFRARGFSDGIDKKTAYPLASMFWSDDYAQ